MIVTLSLQADTEDLELVAVTLLEGADRRRRAGITASAELDADRRAGTYVDAQAILVVTTLAEGDTLERWATSFRGAITQAQAPPAPPPPAPVSEAFLAAEAAVAAAKARQAIPDTLTLAAQHNANLAGTGNGAQPAAGEPTMVDGRPVWVAPEAYEDDAGDELPTAEDAAPDTYPGTAQPAVAVDLTR